jgi:hypothetical protein
MTADFPYICRSCLIFRPVAEQHFTDIFSSVAKEAKSLTLSDYEHKAMAVDSQLLELAKARCFTRLSGSGSQPSKGIAPVLAHSFHSRFRSRAALIGKLYTSLSVSCLQPEDISEVTLDCWYMDDSSEDQRKPHRQEPNVPAGADALHALGIVTWKLDADTFENDPKLQAIRKVGILNFQDCL